MEAARTCSRQRIGELLVREAGSTESHVGALSRRLDVETPAAVAIAFAWRAEHDAVTDRLSDYERAIMGRLAAGLTAAAERRADEPAVTGGGRRPG